MPFPLAAAIILSAIGAGASGYAQSRAASRQSEDARAVNELELALRESELNPFRHANAQARSLMGLDRATNTTPRSTSTDQHGYARLQGGEYRMTPEMVQWLTELRNRIASGEAQNPAITPGYRGPGNNPRSGVQRLVQQGTPAHYMDPLERMLILRGPNARPHNWMHDPTLAHMRE